MTNRLEAWQCIGCGKLEAPQDCIGICEDRKVALVSADDYDRATVRIRQLENCLSLLAHTTPRAGQWEASYLDLQERARRLLGSGRPGD